MFIYILLVLLAYLSDKLVTDAAATPVTHVVNRTVTDAHFFKRLPFGDL